MKTKKIIKALKVIKKYCKNCDKCVNCVFEVGEYAIITCGLCDMTPDDWNIKEFRKRLEGIEEL